MAWLKSRRGDFVDLVNKTVVSVGSAGVLVYSLDGVDDEYIVVCDGPKNRILKYMEDFEDELKKAGEIVIEPPE